MKESRTIHGRWWIFGADHPEYFGILKYTPDTGLCLTVKIARSISIHEILSSSQTASPKLPDVIQGRDERDDPITLFGCQPSSCSRSGGLETYECHPQVAIVGLSIASWNLACFQKVNLYFTLLHRWIGHSRIEYKLTPERVHQIQIQPKRETEFEINSSVSIAINSHVHIGSGYDGVDIEENHYISLEFPQPIRAQSIFSDYAEILRRLFSLFIGSEVVLESLDFEIQNDESPSSRFQLLKRNKAIVRAKREINPSRLIAPYAEITEILPTIFSKWFEYHERLDAVMNLYFAVLFNPALYINHQFLFLAQALEAYHNSNESFGSGVQSTTDFRARRDKIVAAATTEDKEWLKDKLCHANQKTLAQKLDDILSANKEYAERFIKDTPRFAESVRHTRNYYTHFDKEAKERGKVVEDIEEMVLIVSQMQTLLGICVLRDIGIAGKPIDRLINRHNEMTVFSLK